MQKNNDQTKRIDEGAGDCKAWTIPGPLYVFAWPLYKKAVKYISLLAPCTTFGSFLEASGDNFFGQPPLLVSSDGIPSSEDGAKVAGGAGEPVSYSLEVS